MGARTMNMCVGDFGVTTEAVWTHVVPGICLEDHGIGADPGAHYLMTHHLFQIFTYTKDARPKLIAERIYDDPESYSYEKLDPADVVTPRWRENNSRRSWHGQRSIRLERQRQAGIAAADGVHRNI